MTVKYSGFEQSELRSVDNLPDLAQNKVWLGDAAGRPVASDLPITPTGATFILKDPDPALPNAIALSPKSAGILKIDEDGNIVIATGGGSSGDYINVDGLNGIIDGVEAGIAEVSALITTVQAIVESVKSGLTVVQAGAAGAAILLTGALANIIALDVIVNQKAPDDANYILKTPDSDLDNAFALNSLPVGLIKHTGDGTLAQAAAGTDYQAAGSYIDEGTALMYALMF
jgi:hypothetical protein